MADAMDVLARTLSARRRLAEAERMEREAIELMRRSHADDDEKVMVLKTALGNILLDQKDFAAAERLITELLETRRRVLGEASPEVTITIYNLASVHDTSGDRAGALRFYLEACERFAREFDVNHANVKTVLGRLNRLGTYFIQQGDYERAEQALLAVHTTLSDALEPDDSRCRSAARALAGLYRRWQRPDQEQEWQAKADG